MPFKRSFQEGKICATASKHCMAHQGACSLFSHSAITFHYHKKSPQKTEKRRVCHSVCHKSGSGPHFEPCEYKLMTLLTSRLAPMIIGQRSWMCSGFTSRIRPILPLNMPVLARPPACSVIIAMGKPSYNTRSLPFLDFLSAG